MARPGRARPVRRAEERPAAGVQQPGVAPVAPVGRGRTHRSRAWLRFAPVAAASVVAKWYRDTIMAAMAEVYPNRGFEDSGYPTPRNIEVIRRFGRTPWHRQSFRIASLGEKDAE